MTPPISLIRRARSLVYVLCLSVLVAPTREVAAASVEARAPIPIEAPTQKAQSQGRPARLLVVRKIDSHINQAVRRIRLWNSLLEIDRRKITKFSSVVGSVTSVPGPSLTQARAALQTAIAGYQKDRRQGAHWRSYLRHFTVVRSKLVAALNGAGVSGLPSGPVTYRKWAGAFLSSFGAPTCQNNIRLVVAWEMAESTPASFNPLATTYVLPGAWTSGKSRIGNYVSFAQGVQAARDTVLRSPASYNYAPVVDDLLTCAPTDVTARAVRDSEWCHGCTGGNYLVGVLPVVREGWDGIASRRVGGD